MYIITRHPVTTSYSFSISEVQAEVPPLINTYWQCIVTGLTSFVSL
jgi:hypothetical protein